MFGGLNTCKDCASGTFVSIASPGGEISGYDVSGVWKKYTLYLQALEHLLWVALWSLTHV